MILLSEGNTHPAGLLFGTIYILVGAADVTGGSLV